MLRNRTQTLHYVSSKIRKIYRYAVPVFNFPNSLLRFWRSGARSIFKLQASSFKLQLPPTKQQQYDQETIYVEIVAVFTEREESTAGNGPRN